MAAQNFQNVITRGKMAEKLNKNLALPLTSLKFILRNAIFLTACGEKIKNQV